MNSPEPHAEIEGRPVWRMGDQTCPWCMILNKDATALNRDTEPPKPGDITICLTCGGVSIFTPVLSLRRPTEREAKVILEDEQVTGVRAEIIVRARDV